MGYRPAKMPFGYDEDDPRCIGFKARLRYTIEALIGEVYAHFISGGALGIDMPRKLRGWVRWYSSE